MPFIAFDGIDGSGKGTLIWFLLEELTKRKVDVVQTKQPGGSPVGDEIRKILFEYPTTHFISDTAQEFLFAASAVHAAEQIVNPALDKGAFVVADRHWPSGIAYGKNRAAHPLARGAYEGIMKELDRTDLLFLLVGDPEVLLKRAQSRTTETHQAGKKWSSPEKLRAIQETFLENFATHPKVKIVDTTWETPERLFKYQIWPHVEPFLTPRRETKIVSIKEAA